MDLVQWGWSEDRQATLELTEGQCVVRVTSVRRGGFRGISEAGELNCLVSGKFQFKSQNSSEFPVVGDWCIVNPPHMNERGELTSIVARVLERRSKISRVAAGTTGDEQVLASNIDRAFIVTSSNMDFNLNRLKRYVYLAQEGGVEPVIVVSKSDLGFDFSKWTTRLHEILPDIKVVATSVLTEDGLNDLSPLLGPKLTSVFIGSSGVGKSSLVNHLLGEYIQKVKEVRDDDDKGKHTTTSRSLFRSPEYGMIIDTPGLREIQIFGDVDKFQESFHPIQNLEEKCKFADCTHSKEPGCAVLVAIESGEVLMSDFEQYQKLLKEIKHANRRLDHRDHSGKKKKEKKGSKNLKHKKKNEGW